MKKILSIGLAAFLAIASLTGCSTPAPENKDANQNGQEQTSDAKDANNGATFDLKRQISVVSREDGSGTRGAFIELFGVEVKNEDGSKKDMTTKEAIIANKTDVMMTNVAGDTYAVGYISLGSLNDTVKALQIEGVDASAENVKNGSYTVFRPFNIATKGEPTDLAKDFIDFILSKEGQEVVSNGYIAINDNPSQYSGSKPSGKIVVAGSSSVSPVMEKLKEAYEKVNTNATIEIQMSDSTTGMSSTIEGTCDIGMASRDLKDSEKEQLQNVEIALDGIAVIINKENPMTNITKEQVKQIFTGEVLQWNEIVK